MTPATLHTPEEATAYARARYHAPEIVCRVDDLTGFLTMEHNPFGGTIHRFRWSDVFAEADRQERAWAQGRLNFAGGTR